MTPVISFYIPDQERYDTLCESLSLRHPSDQYRADRGSRRIDFATEPTPTLRGILKRFGGRPVKED